ncbi:MAG: glycosyltransferase family 2 protein [Lachnospiraceae bacterium]|nr:glycosyltransferase family 2 protein [Lachnospiraceae bacterium]
MKKISIVIACYNEEDNVVELKNKINEIFNSDLKKYEYQILFMDNDSTDSTRALLEKMCLEDPKHVSAIFNVHNFGSIRSSVYGILQATGDCVVKMCADFQDPPELLVDFVREWELGHKIVLGIKKGSQENKLMYSFRKLYYKLIRSITDIDHIDNFVGYGLYDRKFVEIIRELKDPIPYLRGIVAELGYKFKPIYYVQPSRKSGKSKFNFIRLYDYAMLGITSYSKVPLRIATFFGGIVAVSSTMIGITYLIYKLIYWDKFKGGILPILLGVFFIGAVQLISIGLIGEYILNINIRVINRPMVVEEKRYNLPNKIQEDGEIAVHEAVNNAGFSAHRRTTE